MTYDVAPVVALVRPVAWVTSPYEPLIAFGHIGGPSSLGLSQFYVVSFLYQLFTSVRR